MNMTGKPFILGCCLLPLASWAAGRPNVLFIAVDDLRPELGCYGHAHVHSPNIDRLAASGMRFDRAYCQQAVCNPSRTSLMTGLRPDAIGVTGNHSHFRSKHPDVVTLPQHFKKHGYHAAAIGKIYHGVFPDGASKTTWDTMGDPQSWSEPAIRFGPRYYYTEEGIAAAKAVYRKVYKPKAPGPNDWTTKLVFGPATESPDVSDNVLYDGKVADAAVLKLRELKTGKQPFFLAVGFIKPHSPYIAPKKYFDLYKGGSLPKQTDFPTDAPSFAGHGSGELRRYTDQPKKGAIPDGNQRRVRHAYFACISFIDAQVGRVLDELDRQGLNKNTIVVLYGDHGYHLGEQGLWGKTTNFELDTRVPLIVRTPGMKAAGTSSRSLVELVDLYPTLAQLAGLPVSPNLQGKSMAPVLADPSHATKSSALSQYPRGGGLMGYSMRTDTHRLTQWLHVKSGEVRATELYEYAGGPVEQENLAAAAPDVVRTLSGQLRKAFSLPSPKDATTDASPSASEAVISFETAKPGPFAKLGTALGTWIPGEGKTIIDSKHAKTGKHCLQLTGGKKTDVVLELADGADTSGVLTFWAERWTSRKPFSFRIEKQAGGKWTEIFNGDRTVRVGRAFLSHVSVPLGDTRIERLRFTVTSPANTGILIDDMKCAPARPQRIVAVEALPFTLPALIGTKASALLKLRIATSGQLDPISVTGLQLTLDGTTDPAAVRSLQVFAGGSGGRFPGGQLIVREEVKLAGGDAVTLTCPAAASQLADGENIIWVAAELSADANPDGRLGARLREVHLSNGDKVELDAPASVQRLGVAVRQGGDDGVHTYRIPGLATTNKGTLIGVYDVRRRGGGDLPGDIDVGMSRSTDGGRTWEPMKVVMDMGADPQWRYDGIGDPAVLVDRGTGTVWVAATWSHGNRSWRGSGPGLTPEETGQFMLARSDDGGVTWSKPINITRQVKRPEWCFILQGPGKGITMRDGTIVFPAQYQDPPEKKRLPHSTIIYSRDHGKTWQAGTGAFDDTTEAQVVEVEPGVLMLNCRYNRKGVRVVMTTRDMGKTWQRHPTSERALIEPGACMASLIDVDQELGKDVGGWLLFSNPDSTRGRKHITIKASPDRGLTWPKAYRLLLDEERSAGYSCMSMIDEKTVGILYEGSQAHMTFQRVPLRDILGIHGSQASTSPPPLDLFVLTGQSNSLGTVNPRDLQSPNPPPNRSDETIPFFWSNRSTRAGDGPPTLIGNSGGEFLALSPQQGEGKHPVFWGPEVGFARSLAEAGHADLAIVKASRGGGGNGFWLKGSKDDHMYRHVVQTVSDAISAIPGDRPYRIRAILYVQGESDGRTEAGESGERLGTLLANLRRDLPNAVDARLIVGGIAAAGGQRDVVRRGQAAAAGRHPAIEYIDNLDLQPKLYDRLHFDKEAKLELGRRMAERWLAIKNTNAGSLTLPRVFGDHMVLQAETAIPVWGRAAPSSTVVVTLGDEKQETKADAEGEWQIRLKPRKASTTPLTMSVRSGEERIELNDILIGEVWVCAGQSNMEWRLNQSTNGAVEIAAADHPQLRLLNLVGGARGSSGSYSPSHLARLTPETYCEGSWQAASSESAPDFSAVGWYFGRHLLQELDVPVGLICPAVGGTPAEAWIPRDAIAADPSLKGLVTGNWLDNDQLGEFCPMRGQQNLLAAIQAGQTIPGDEAGPNHSFKPGFMWDAGIAPLIPYAIRGAIWYQGESNAETRERVRQHSRLFPLLISEWRKRWGQGEFPFLFVQLPALNRPEWPRFRDSQRGMLAQIPNAGMAITIDTGLKGNVHPPLKKPVGERLARWALGTTYGQDAHAVYSGPLLQGTKRGGKSMDVTFSHAGEGLRAPDGKPLRHFEVCGPDRVFHPADAAITGPETIRVSSPKVSEPIHVRYAWRPFPEPGVNLVNSAGLPASPFTTQEEDEKSVTAKRPNILFIVSEDNSDHFGCYGETRVHTPHLDRLAAGGVRYTRAYVPYSVCSPSRAAFLTGLYTRQNGHIGLATHRFSMHRDFRTMPAYFRDAGYYVGFLGKTHVNPERLVEDHIDHRAIRNSNFGKTISIETYAEEARTVMENAAAARQPFLLIINYADAHRKFVGKSKNGFPTVLVEDEIEPWPWIGSDSPHLREELRNYLNCINRLDEGIGMVLEDMEKLKTRDNTLVVYISDHGADFPRAKGSIYENGTRIPMIVHHAGSFSQGKVENALVSTVDILPTMLRTAGLPVPDELPGIALQGIDTGSAPPRRYIHTFTTGSAPSLLCVQFGIRDDRYKLVYNPDRAINRLAVSRYKNSKLPEDQHVQSFLYPPEYELFDLREDPYEWKNLADSPEHTEIRERLLAAMRKFQRDIKDPFADKDNLATFLAEQKEHLTKSYRKAGFRWSHLDIFKGRSESK